MTHKDVLPPPAGSFSFLFRVLFHFKRGGGGGGFKGIVHPKKNNYVIIYSNLNDLLSFVQHKIRYFKDCW